MSEIAEGNALFKQYGRHFQERIFHGLLTDREWAVQMTEVMRSDYFDLKYLAYLADKYFRYFERYKSFPSLQLLVTIIKDDLKESPDIALREQVVDYLTRLRTSPNVGDIVYVKEKSLDFCRKQALKEALEKSVELISADKYEDVLGIMKKAVSVGMPSSVGHNFFDDMEARFTRINRMCCPTGIKQLDARGILNGGIGKGELATVLGCTGSGKSHFLVALGAHALRVGKNVIHYTFELSEEQVGIRYDSNLTGIPSNDVIDAQERVRQHYTDHEFGKLIIKEYPTGSASIYTLRSHLEKLALRGFVPHVIIIDYVDIMRSTKEYDALRHELKLIYEELRNLAMELAVPVITASQSNRAGSEVEVLLTEHISESYGKAQVADLILTLSRRSIDKASGQGRLFVAKNRNGRDGLVFPVLVDTATSTFTVVDEEQTLNEALDDDERQKKQLMREKWKQVTDGG